MSKAFWFAAPPWRFHWAHARNIRRQGVRRQGPMARPRIGTPLTRPSTRPSGRRRYGVLPGRYLRHRFHSPAQQYHAATGDGSVIEASTDATAYDAAEPNQWDKFQDFGHSHWHNSLIWATARECFHRGEGLITGKALVRERGGAATKPSP